MKSQAFLLFIFLFVYFSCTPPETVRLQDYLEQPEAGYFAHIPVGLNGIPFALGESITETEWKIGKRIELLDTENEQYKLSRFVIHHSNLDADTTITCGFHNGRLSAVLSTTSFKNPVIQSDEFLEKLGNVFSFMPELKSNLNLNKSIDYTQMDNVYSCRYSFNKTPNGFSVFEYLISYTNNTESFDLIVNS